MRMKRMSLTFALIGALFFAGCADPVEKRSPEEVQGQLERGVTGQGRIGPENRAPGDTANEHAVPQNHP
jgi:PBP1b-binding outer membrane lipoprotein LpoB